MFNNPDICKVKVGFSIGRSDQSRVGIMHDLTRVVFLDLILARRFSCSLVDTIELECRSLGCITDAEISLLSVLL